MAFTYRNVVQRALSYAEHDENLQTVEQLHDAAVQARDVAVLNAPIYATTAAGLAATASGEYFSIPSPDAAGFLDLYLNDSETATLIKQYPSSGGVVKLDGANTWTGLQKFYDITFDGASRRIRGTWTGSNLAERTCFQSGASDSATDLTVIPSGTSVISGIRFLNSSAAANCAYGRFSISAGGANFESAIAGSGSYLPMLFFTGGSERARIDNDGNVGVGTVSPSAKLDVNSDTVRLRTARTPASATASGNAGDICWDSTHLFICVATNTWRRVAHASW